MADLQRKITTTLCVLYLVASATRLKGVYWDKQPILMEKESTDPATKIMDKTEKQLTEYFAGKRKQFDLPLQAEGTDFQKRVWAMLSDIPYGTTCAYKDIAEKLKNKKAYRAVGTANGNNPHSIIVPCHRVIAADGTLGGYGGGLKIKQELLNLEKMAAN